MDEFTRRYEIPCIDHVEDVENYIPGGFLPLDLGDTLSNGRYQIIHKLGYGGSSTIWLARDQQFSHPDTGKLVTIKILRADRSNMPPDLLPDVVIPTRLKEDLASIDRPQELRVRQVQDWFVEESSNGRHACLVSPFAGPSLGTLVRVRLQSGLCRKLAHQVAHVIEAMHFAGYVHGDISTKNILFQTHEDMHCLSNDALCEILGKPETDEVITLDGSPAQLSAPRHLVEAFDSKRLLFPAYIRENVMVIDFGQSFAIKTRPKDYKFATPIHYAPPESIFDSQFSAASDIWCLACTIFEIRSGDPLFLPFFQSHEDIQRQFVALLGKLPNRWWTRFEDRHTWFNDDGGIKPVESQGLPFTHSSSIRDRLREIGEKDMRVWRASIEGSVCEQVGVSLNETEVDLLGDLLERMLRYNPEERINIHDVVTHPWFDYNESTSERNSALESARDLVLKSNAMNTIKTVQVTSSMRESGQLVFQYHTISVDTKASATLNSETGNEKGDAKVA